MDHCGAVRILRVATAVALTCVASLTTGCGNWVTTDINGRVGVTVDAAGAPVILVEVCHGVVTEVYTVAGSRGRARTLRATTPRAASFSLDVSAPGPGWRGDPLQLPLGSGLTSVVASGGSRADSEAGQVDFTAADLAELTPATVQYDGRVPDSDDPADYGKVTVPMDRFHKLACG